MKKDLKMEVKMQQAYIRNISIFLLILSLSPSFLHAQIGWGQPVNCGPNINTPDLEDGHCISNDSAKFYFSSIRPEGSENPDIWVSEYSGGWQPAMNLGDSVNTELYEYDPFITRDGNKLYFDSDRLDGYGNFDIWVSEYVDGHWRPATNLSDINTGHHEMCPFISGDGLHLYFASDRTGGQGNMDIWVSEYSGGHWQPPVNMGANINSIQTEYSPCLTPDSLTLYFASDRPGGYGYYDIMFSQKSGNVWQPAINIGNIINTANNDLCPYVSSNGMKLYFSTWERPGGYGTNDIWVSEWQGNVEENKAIKPAISGNIIPTVITQSSQLPKDNKYKVITITGRIINPLNLVPGIYFLEQNGKIVQKFLMIR